MSEMTGLYLISPSDFDLGDFSAALEAALASGDVDSFQLRMKNSGDDAIREAIRTLMPICHAHDVAFILNDRADLAAEMECDGVHLGQTDGDVAEARKLLGPDAAIGVTCHDSRHLAFEAGDAGADYVAFGAFFPTQTKDTQYAPEPELLTIWSEIAEIPSVAIGGITPENCGILVSAGADFIATCSSVWEHPEGPAAAVKAFHEAMSIVPYED